jgi:hypothetical protein
VATPSARDAGWWAAFIGFGVFASWIAAIVSRRLGGGPGARSSFTLYRGAPPA